MALTQYLVSTMSIGNPVGDQPGDMMLGRWTNTNATQSIAECPTAGTFQRLRIKLDTAPGTGTSRTFTVRVNGVSSALSVTIPDTATEGQDSTHSITMAAGDTVSIWCSRAGTPATSIGYMVLEFVSTQGATGIYGSQGNPPNNFTRYAPALFGDENAPSATEADAASLIPMAGTITHWRAVVTTAPGAGKSWALTIYRNGVAQNGGGGTPDTRITIADAATTGNSSTALTLAAGDRVSVEFVPTGTPANNRTAVSVAFRTDTATLPFGMQHNDNANTADRYHPLTSTGVAWSATNTTQDGGGVETFNLSGMYAYVTVAPGAGKSWDFTLLDNGVATTQTVTIADTNQSGVSTGAAVPIVAGANGRYSLLKHPVSSPANTGNPKVVFGGSGVLTAPPSTSDLRMTMSYLKVGLSAAAVVPAPTASACTGGGTVATSTDPATGVSVATATSPIIYCQIQTDSGVKTYGYGDLGTGSTFHIDGRLLSMTPISRALTDMHGNWETSTVTLYLSDYDRSLRGLKATGELRNKRVDVYAIDLLNHGLGSTPWRLGQFVIREFYARPNLEFEIRCEDYFGSSVSEFSLAKLIPQRKFTSDDFPNLDNPDADVSPGNQLLSGKAVPIIYGSCSDEADPQFNIGVVPCYYVGQRTINGTVWDEYIVCEHAIKSVQSWFAADPTGTFREKQPVATEGVDFLIPGYSGYTAETGSANKYVDYNGNRYTRIFARGTKSEAARTGKVPITLCVCGIESTGDGTGTMIDSLPRQLQHLISNFILQNYTSGNWPAIPTVNSYSRIKSSTFEAAKTLSEARVAGGYKGAFVLGVDGAQHTVRDLIKDACLSGDFRLAVNKEGQIICKMQNPAAAAVKAQTDLNDILAESFEPNVVFSDTYNRVVYRYAKRYVALPTEPTPEARQLLPPNARDQTFEWLSGTGPLTRGDQHVFDTPSITALGETKTLDQTYTMVRETATADSVAAKVLARQLTPVRGPLASDYRLTDVELGDNLDVTHFEGLSSTGVTNRIFEVQKLHVDATMDPESRLALTITADTQDVTGL